MRSPAPFLRGELDLVVEEVGAVERFLPLKAEEGVEEVVRSLMLQALVEEGVDRFSMVSRVVQVEVGERYLALTR